MREQSRVHQWGLRMHESGAQRFKLHERGPLRGRVPRVQLTACTALRGRRTRLLGRLAG